MAIWGLDYETSSETDIDLGSYRYGECPSTTIILFAIAKDDEEPLLWDFTDPDGLESQFAWEALREAAESDEIIRAFNVQMEIAICRYVMPRQLGIREPSLDKWRDTQALCNRAALQTNLAMASKDVGLPESEAKESIGKKLIAIFCNRTKEKTLEPPPGMKDPDSIKPLKNGKFTAGRKPRNRKTFSPVHDEEILWDWLIKVDSVKMTVREAWNLFREYCRKDVIAERAVARKLAKFELEGDILESFQFDLRMNYKGVPINRSSVAHAQKLVDKFSERLEVRFKNLCGYTSSQNKALLVWLRERGYPGFDMQADTIEEILDEPEMLRLMTPEAQTILKMRNLLSFAALKKLKKMKDACCSDGYVRGTTKWHGARTGRATGSIIQPQNMRKATIPDSATAYEMICMEVNLETFAFFYDSPLEAIASCIRHFMQPHEGLMLSADYKGVEARITPWLSGDMRKLRSILDGVDPYRSIAVKLFNVPYDAVSSLQRTISKPVELGCCFGVGGRGLRKALLTDYGIEKTIKECDEWVRIYRETHPETVQCWKDIEEAAKTAIREGKTTSVAGGKLAFGRARISGISYLVMRLPSGRKLFYPHPEIKRVWKDYSAEEMAESEWKAERKGYFIDQISFYGRRPNNAGWGRITTWGSRLFENCLTGDTEVLTEKGWLPITECAGLKVFDGVEWVNHEGIKESWANDVIRLDGLGVTCKHEILTSQGWKHACETEIRDAQDTCRAICSSSGETIMGDERPDRIEVRVSNSNEDRTDGASEDSLGMPVRLRENLCPEDLVAHAYPTPRAWVLLALLCGQADARDPWHVKASRLRGLPEHARPVSVAYASILPQLRRQGDLSLPEVAGGLRKLLGRHEERLSGRPDVGSQRQQWELREIELPVDDPSGQQPKHTLQRLRGDTLRTPLPFRNPSEDGHWEVYPNIPLESRSPEVGGPDPAGECYQQVYDLLNCGPRHRFVVRAPRGEPIIAHNCVQATGADLLNHGCIQAEKQGYDIRMIIHDEILGMDTGDLEELMRLFCSKQPWAETFPLESSGARVPFYLKDD